MANLVNILAASLRSRCVNAPIPCRRRQRGFTVMELTMGMVVMAVIMGAVAGLMTATGAGWKQSGTAESSTSNATQTHLRMARVFRGVKQIGYVQPGSLNGVITGNEAAALVWKADTNLDGKMQMNELAVIKYCPSADPNDGLTIRQYQISSTSNQPDAANEVTTTDYYKAIYTSMFYTQFLARSDVGYTVVARNVAAAQFHKNDSGTTNRPSLEYVLNLQRGTTTETEYGTVAVRVATTLPVSQR